MAASAAIFKHQRIMPTKITAKHGTVGFQTILSNGRHAIVGDEPINSKGTDLGMSPPELVLAGLAMCKTATVRFIARKNNWEVENVDAQLEQVVERRDGKLVTKVKVAIQIEGNINEEQRAELMKQADACYIHRMLDGEFEIESAVDSLEELELA
ncbi:putative redox protein [Spirosomataceae bacterium TFI 002]|nr:putative redox protein [Spirosomataceae bacterium TFI 002]